MSGLVNGMSRNLRQPVSVGTIGMVYPTEIKPAGIKQTMVSALKFGSKSIITNSDKPIEILSGFALFSTH